MDKHIQMEHVIKAALQRKVEGIEAPTDLLTRINASLANISIKTKRETSSYRSAWRAAAVAVTVIIVSGLMLLTFSKEARVMAAQLANSIKKIFVVEKAGDSYRAVVKPVDEFKLSLGLCEKASGLDDYRLGEKVEFQVHFPEVLEGYQLDFRVIGVKLDQRMDVDSFRQLKDQIVLAIHDDRALEDMKIYDAHRYTGAFYHKGGAMIGIYVMGRAYRIRNCVNKKVTIRDCEGFWLEHPRRQYFEDENAKEQNLQVRHSLFWVKNGRGFYLRPEGEDDITFDEAIRIAELFVEGY